MKAIHGGDIYRNKVTMDFSVNGNPLGIPEKVKEALHKAVDCCEVYPDIQAQRLSQAVSHMLKVPGEQILFGNGASELFMAVVHALRPGRIVIPVPSFYGYEHAAEAVGSETVFYRMSKEQDFTLDRGILNVLSDAVDLLFLANPNNPTGAVIEHTFLMELLTHCREKNITVVLDECFVEFCREDHSMIRHLEQFPNLIVVRAFTKLFAIPGVRLGYLACSEETTIRCIASHLPEWNLSVFAQMAGFSCCYQQEFVEQTRQYVTAERKRVSEVLKQAGVQVFPGEADYLLLYSTRPLYEELLKKGILIRDCSNYRGLGPGYYRIAVKTIEENNVLLKEMGIDHGNRD